MTNLESATEGFIVCNFLVQSLNLFDQSIEGFVCKPILICGKTIRIEPGFHFKETESSSKGIINHRQTTVSSIHHANDVKISRNRERHTVICQCGFSSTIILFNQHQKLTEDFAHIAAVDLVDDEEIVLVGVVCRSLTETIEDAISQFEVSAVRTITHDEILIGIILMELNQFNAGFIHFSHHGIRKFSRGECLAYTGSALKNNIHLVPEQSNKNIIPFFGHIYLAQKIGFGICRESCGLSTGRIFFADYIHDEVKLAFSKLKQAACRLNEELHLFKLRTFSQCSIFNRRYKTFFFLEGDNLSIIFLSDSADSNNLFNRL